MSIYKHLGVAQCDLNGVQLAEYPNIKTASEITGISYASISQALGGRAKTGAGFIWKRTTAEAYKNARDIDNPWFKKPVVMYDRNGNKVAEFESVKAAHAASGESCITICHAARRGRFAKKPTRKGHKWQYKCLAAIIDEMNKYNNYF